MSTKIESFEHNGRKVAIYFDDDARSPRGEDRDCNLATLVCWHRRRNLGDEQIEGMTEAELRVFVTERDEEILAMLPLYIYEHGGVTMSTGAFGDRWDSGQVGWAYITKSRAEELGCVGAAWDAVHYCEAIKNEVETYAMFLRGEVYGYVVKGIDGEELDSCWGFYGLDDVRREAKEAAEDMEDPAVDRQAAELAARATFAGVS